MCTIRWALALVLIACGDTEQERTRDVSVAEVNELAETAETAETVATDGVSDVGTSPDAASADASSDAGQDVLDGFADTTDGAEHTEPPDISEADPCQRAPPEPPPTVTDLEHLAPTIPGTVRGVWLSPSDRPFTAGLHQRLDAWLTLSNGFFTNELERWTGSAQSFTPQRGADGRWDVVFLQGEHDLAFYHAHPNSPDAPGEALREIFARLPAAFHAQAIIVYFYDTAVRDGAVLAHTGQAGSAAPWQGADAGYALIGAHVLGFGFDTVRTDPTAQVCVFDDTTPSGLEDYDALGVWRPLDRGEWASTFLGASIHELGHAFGLEHVFDDGDGDGVENNLMGNGFRRFGGRFSARLPAPPTLLGPTSARALAPHPYLRP